VNRESPDSNLSNQGTPHSTLFENRLNGAIEVKTRALRPMHGVRASAGRVSLTKSGPYSAKTSRSFASCSLERLVDTSWAWPPGKASRTLSMTTSEVSKNNADVPGVIC
jgi:hypothetical protein